MQPVPCKAAGPFMVMAKPVGSRCNLNCEYCYYKSSSQAGNSGGTGGATSARGAGGAGGVIGVETLERFIHQYISASPGPAVFFCWHGGEPTLAGISFYKKVVELQKKYTPYGGKCVNNIQTNGRLIDDEWCKFLSDNSFDVGLSIDGSQWLHDMYRKDRAGAGSYSAAKSAAHRMIESGVRMDLLCTVTPEAAAAPNEVYESLREFNNGWIQFIPIVRRGAGGLPAKGCVSPEGYGDFLCKVFDEWVSRDLGRLGIQTFAEAGTVLSGGEAGLCWMAPECGRVLILEQNGDVYSCDHFVAQDYKIGNIFESTLGELVESPAQRSFGSAKRANLPAQCRSCQWLRLCNGGCPKDRFACAGDGEPGLNYLCAGLKKFFSHSEQPLKKIVDMSSAGHKPKTIMAHLRSEALSHLKGIGRNDPCPCGSGLKAKNCCMRNIH